MKKPEEMPTLDVVIALYNEEEALPLLGSALSDTFSKANLRAHGIESIRFLMIDDGSTDRTAQIICQFIDDGLPAELYRLSRNFGHQNAVSAGLDQADADLVAIMDADLQDPPEIIYEMVKKWREDYHVAYGQRTRRKEGLIKRLGYWLFYRLLTLMSDIQIPSASGDFCLLDRCVVDAMRQLPENLRFVRGLRAWVGFRQVAVPYERAARQAGKPKYGMKELYQLATDGLASTSVRPLRFAQVVSFVFGVLSVLMLVCFLAIAPSGNSASIPPLYVLLFAVLVLGNAILALCIYVVGAYLSRAYLEIKGRPPYVIMETFQHRDEDG